MTDSRSQRLGLESGSAFDSAARLEAHTGNPMSPFDGEIAHSIAISLMGLRIAAERIADRLDENTVTHLSGDKAFRSYP